jgi:hypothetical protein
MPDKPIPATEYEDVEILQDYDESMTGGDMSDDYLTYGGG